MIRFLYHNEVITLEQSRADTTVLEWLREHAAQTGTKEGCGTGDCGACTVVVAEPATDGTATLNYFSINSCIAFVGSLHAKQLISVEALAQNKQLHVVQQTMVDLHGSQCGFCTPGFIMSLFALVHNRQALVLGKAEAANAINESPTELLHLIDRYLGGNLCRCTGYAPIRRAALSALQLYKPDQFEQAELATIKKLNSLVENPPMDARFYLPSSLGELANLRINYPEARLLAGGTDLGLEVTQFQKSIDTVLYLKNVPELIGIKESADTLVIGAAVSLNRCMDALQKIVPNSKAMMLRFGSEQVRNQGTIGGNIANASPIGDLPPLLLAMDASLCIQCGEQSRQLKLEEFYIAYKKTALSNDEFIRSIHIPIPVAGSTTFVYKISKRLDDDISAVCGVFSLELNEGLVRKARIAFGGMAEVPKRATNAEVALVGKVLDDSSLANVQKALAEDFSPISDARASATYRQRVAANLVKRCWLNVNSPSVRTQVIDHVGR